ncbi:MAG: hypothetical protein H7125_00590 [Proteobacteria bacterium]|nr:hypothetical protein [Burkholderiales bacterium]
MSEPSDWFIYESELFVGEVAKHLTVFELDALRHHLARAPFAGKAVEGASPLISLDFAGATILYSVNPAKRTIALIQVAKATGKPIEIDPETKSKLREIGKIMRRGGYLAAGKEAAEWLFDILKDWL